MRKSKYLNKKCASDKCSNKIIKRTAFYHNTNRYCSTRCLERIRWKAKEKRLEEVREKKRCQ